MYRIGHRCWYSAPSQVSYDNGLREPLMSVVRDCKGATLDVLFILNFFHVTFDCLFWLSAQQPRPFVAKFAKQPEPCV